MGLFMPHKGVLSREDLLAARKEAAELLFRVTKVGLLVSPE